MLPKHPERICWGCSLLCPAGELACGNGSIRTPHPAEIFGDDWLELREELEEKEQGAAPSEKEQR